MAITALKNSVGNSVNNSLSRISQTPAFSNPFCKGIKKDPTYCRAQKKTMNNNSLMQIYSKKKGGIEFT